MITILAPLMAMIVLVAGPGWGRFNNGLDEAFAFAGFDDLARRRVAALPADVAALRKSVDALTAERWYCVHLSGIFILLFGRRPVFCLTVPSRMAGLPARCSETASSEYILSGSWTKWRADMERPPPAVIVTVDHEPIPPESPLAEMLHREYRFLCGKLYHFGSSYGRKTTINLLRMTRCVARVRSRVRAKNSLSPPLVRA